jgi:cardiolipin synthase
MSGPVRHVTTGYTIYNRARLVRGGRDYFTLMETMIRSARYSIHLQIYIFEEDSTGLHIASLLREAAARGVEVWLMVDGYASRGLSETLLREFETSGVHFRYFEPLLQGGSWYVGRRMHHKILVADALRGLIGGLNVSDRYNDIPGHPAWLDWAVEVEGEAAFELFGVCVKVWMRSPSAARKMIATHPSPVFDIKHTCPVRVRRNDWVNRKGQVSRSYIELSRNAQQEVIIMSSYFLPGRAIRRSLRQATRRGVTVKLILAGISDVSVAKHAERYMYRYLLRCGAQIYEYRRNVLHGKIAVRDGLWVTAGSYNVNNISAYASVELNLDVDDPAFGTTVRQELQSIIEADCIRITDDQYRTLYHWPVRLLQWLSYQLFRLVFFLFTFYFRQHHRD